jgi:hypothetical protein
VPYPRNQGPARSSPGVRLLFRALSRRVRPLTFSGTAPLREPARSSESGPPLLGFLLPRTQLRRVPLSPRRPFPAAPVDEGIATPSSVPSSGFLPLSTVPAAHPAQHGPLSEPAVTPYAPRRFATLFHAARVPMELPFRAFPSRGAVPALAGLLLPCEFDIRPPPARRGREVHDRFPTPRQLLACSPPESEPRRMNRDSGFPRSLERSRLTHRNAPP